MQQRHQFLMSSYQEIQIHFLGANPLAQHQREKEERALLVGPCCGMGRYT